MTFVEYVRTYHKELDYENLHETINKAIDRCIEEDILADFLRENRLEVIKVTQLDYTFERQIELERDEARQEGKIELLVGLVKDKTFTIAHAAEKAVVSEEEFKEEMTKLSDE